MIATAGDEVSPGRLAAKEEIRNLWDVRVSRADPRSYHEKPTAGGVAPMPDISLLAGAAGKVRFL
jgi:hypothetical protein